MDRLRKGWDQSARLTEAAFQHIKKGAAFLRDEYFRLAHPLLLRGIERLKAVPREDWIRWSTRAAIVIGVCGVSLFSGVYGCFALRKNDMASELGRYREFLQGRGDLFEAPPIRIYDRDGKLLGEYLGERQSRLNLRACQSMTWLKAAAVASEDRDFYEHRGVSIRGIFRAFFQNLISLSIREGGGSISQQTARILFTSSSWPGIIRKVFETYAAFLIESRLSKDEILCLYLNKVYMGEGRIGAEEASYFYFQKPPQTLGPAEAAMIVGLFPSPARYSPLNNIRFAMKKQEAVLNALVRDEKIKSAQVNALIQQFKYQYGVVVTEKDGSSGTLGLYGANRSYRSNFAPDANDAAVEFLRQHVDEEEIRAGGLKIYTTIDFSKQAAALSAVRGNILTLRAQLASKSPFPPQETEKLKEGLNGVLLSVEPRTGEILALVGGYGADESGRRSRVYQMRRQPGSSIKGFLYATALDRGLLKEDSEVNDEPVNIGGYRPQNWYGGFKGKMTLRHAIAQSVNTVAVLTLKDLGIGTFRDRIADALDVSSFEIADRMPGNLSLALGSGELSPEEMSRLYAPLLNGGRRVHTRLIRRIEDAKGRTVFMDEFVPDRTRLISRASCSSILRLMGSVIESEGTAEWIGKYRQTHAGLNFPAAAKTGTVETESSVSRKFRGMQGVHDAWFVGLVPGEATIVWVGQDEGAPFPGSGAGSAGGIWLSYVQAIRNSIHGEFPREDDPESEPDIAPISDDNPDEKKPSDREEERPLPDENGPAQSPEGKELRVRPDGQIEKPAETKPGDTIRVPDEKASG